MRDITRRNILTGSILALGALTTQPLLGSSFSSLSSQDWIAILEKRLRTFSDHTSRIVTASGEIELYCEMADLVAFGSSHGNFAGLGVRIMAQGNRLSLEKGSERVAIILNPRTPPNSIPA
ncbi:MAG: hypothetical protein ACRCXD_11550 [Luteolibacter sp.]